jgi:putative methyltransferase (TIGR04325 family)
VLWITSKSVSAPIALFVYARPDHVRRTVEALLKNSEAANSDLIVLSDAARTSDKVEAVRQVREYVKGIEGFRSLTIHHRPENYGLAKSIIEGVSQVLTAHDRVIVMEDDLETSPLFLRYMNEALDRYAEDDRVISVHGYIYPLQKTLPEAFFLRGADCWGWATWRRGWKHFNPDGQFLLDELKRQKLLKAFDFNGAYSYSGMLQGQINGTNDSWAVRWHASAFLANKLTLYPGRSLVHNIGNDSTGTHCGTNAVFDAVLSSTPIRLDDVAVEESVTARKTIEDFLRAKRTPLQRVLGQFMPENVRQRLTGIAKDWLPPVLVRQFSLRKGEITFEGPFATWNEAVNHSSGYAGHQILEKVLASTLMVKRGEAVFERDSVLFDEIQYAWPVTAGLMWVAARNGGRLSVLDFGGSLGSSYFQNREFLADLPNVRWSVVEQAHFVDAGRKHIQDERLVFYPTIAECVAEEKPNVALLSSVLQYLEDPYAVLDELAQSGVEIILVDRTSFHDGKDDLIAVQNVAKAIYPASYPLWILSKKRLISHLSKKFILVAETLSPEGFVQFDKGSFSFNGLIMKRKTK